MLEDPPPAALKPDVALEPPDAAELPLPEDAAQEAPTVVMLMPPVPLLAPEPPVLVAWELLDVIRSKPPVLPGPADAALPPALREKSPRGKESEEQDKNLQHLSRTKLQYDKMIYYIFLQNIILLCFISCLKARFY